MLLLKERPIIFQDVMQYSFHHCSFLYEGDEISLSRSSSSNKDLEVEPERSSSIAESPAVALHNIAMRCGTKVITWMLLKEVDTYILFIYLTCFYLFSDFMFPVIYFACFQVEFKPGLVATAELKFSMEVVYLSVLLHILIILFSSVRCILIFFFTLSLCRFILLERKLEKGPE